MYSTSTDIQYYSGIEWPYPVNYDKVNRIQTDFLVIGGGVAGCAAAMAAKKRGVSVAIVDKGPLIRSGSAGTGIDHWHDMCTNPRSKVTPEQLVEWYAKTPYWGGNYVPGHMIYIHGSEAYDTLLDLEKLGMNIRDDGEFEGSDFCDPDTGLMYAYDYDHCIIGRLKGGAMLKPLMKAEVDRLGIESYEYIIISHLLTEGGKTGPGAKVIGAMGFSGRTGECYVFNSKATLVSCGIPQGEWCFSSELNGGSSRFWDPNNNGEAQTMMAEVGALVTQVEHTYITCANGGQRWPMYGTADCNNTWYGAPIVDATGKRLPTTQNGKEVGPENLYKNTWPGIGDGGVATSGALCELPRNLPELIMKGEYKLPFYADLSLMSADERRVMWGLMIGNEGKTNYPVYKVYNANGFDPDKDMLQVPVMAPSSYEPRRSKPFWNGEVYDPWRESHQISNFAIYDWTLKTTVDGLYVAGLTTGNNFASGAYSTGWYAGRNAAKYAKTQEFSPIDEKQLEAWKEQVYAPIKRTDGIGWKEFKAGCARVMQCNCGEYKSDEILKNGLDWFDSIEKSEFTELYARNPHELMRAQECYTQLQISKMTLHASLARKCTNEELGFYRLDNKDIDPREYEKYITTTMVDGKIVTGEVPLDYYLKPPYAPTYKENYEKYSAFDA